MNNQKNPFLDNRGLMAVILIGAFFAVWQWYMNKTYPPKPKVQTPVVTSEPTSVTEKAGPQATGTVEQKAAQNVQVETRKYDGETINFEVSNIGMGLKDVKLKKYTDRSNNPIHLGDSDLFEMFEMRWSKSGLPIVFKVSEPSKGHFIGTSEKDGVKISRELKYDEQKQIFESNIEILNAKEGDGLDIIIPEKIHNQEGGSFLFPSYDHQDFVVIHEGKDEKVNFSSAKERVQQDFKVGRLAGISSQYFTAALLDHSDLAPDLRVEADIEKKQAKAVVSYRPIQASASLKLTQIFFVGPKSIDLLEKINPDFIKVIDFGSLEFIAKPMLTVMKTFFSWFANWGVAIIFLTLLVRLLVFPLYMMSTKSMKAMQKVQPMIQALREKYKDDPMTMNREMMALMKQNGANPLGGCLPMLLQIPIFFALFRVIGSSVELYQAPFGLWIHDLSLHDPFFVLPVLMGITMFVQQKITPTTMDPAQAKILAFMPIIFSVFMLYLPSGLTLYMFVSAVFGILQQKLMMRDATAS